jgi:aminoglycoside phosphotransferase (APT) family kinase protein
VLDWELSAVGDPLADLGGLLVHWIEPGDEVRPFEDSPTDVPGFATRDEFVATYLREAGLPDDTDVTWYHAFGLWRLAVALDGVHRRFSGGAYGGAGEGAHVADLPRLVPRLIDEAARLLGI